MDKDNTENEKKQIKSLIKAFKILDLLKDNPSMSLNKIAKEISSFKTTTYGLLSTLVDCGYVEKASNFGEYKLGYKLYELGMSVTKQWKILEIAPTYMKRLADELNETVHLTVLRDGEVLYIAKYEGNQFLKIVSEVGSKLPAHCTGVGKVLLSGLSDEEIEHIVSLKGLKPFTKNTITDLTVLKEEIKHIREQGYAVDNEEIMEGLKCIAVPIYNNNKEINYAMSVSGPVNRLSGEQFYKTLELLRTVASEISTNLGYRNNNP